MTPVIGDDHSIALAIYSRRTDGAPYSVTYQAKNLGLTRKAGYTIKVMRHSHENSVAQILVWNLFAEHFQKKK